MKKNIKVLFVCSGNICRSPMAEIIFNNMLKKGRKKGIISKSAGIDAAVNMPMSDYSSAALKQCGEVTPRKIIYATQMTKQMIKEYDHIVCMTKSHKYQIDPKGFWPHVFTVDAIDVADPWGESIDSYISVCKHLQESIKKLYFKLCRN